MSINLENPDTILGKVDAAANYVAQIRLAMMIGDKGSALAAVEQAERLLFNATNALGELPADWHTDSSLATWFPLTAEAHTAKEKALATVRGNAALLRRALASMAACAEAAVETMPHGSDRYDLAVSLDFAREALNRMPNDKGEQRCQAVGGNAEGEVPTTAPDDQAQTLPGNRAGEGGEVAKEGA